MAGRISPTSKHYPCMDRERCDAIDRNLNELKAQLERIETLLREWELNEAIRNLEAIRIENLAEARVSSLRAEKLGLAVARLEHLSIFSSSIRGAATKTAEYGRNAYLETSV